MNGGMIIMVDIDGTLCSTPGTDYEKAVPIYHRIRKINKLYEHGHTIIIYTARGSGSGTDYTQLTKHQLNDWGVKYNKLSIREKPVFDLLIDDKAMSLREFDSQVFI